MISLLFKLSFSDISYTLAATELIISGNGEITRDGIESKEANSVITKVTILNGPEKIGEKSFSKCTKLSHVIIPQSISLIIGQPFINCKMLTKIEVDKQNTNFLNDENFILYSRNKKMLIKAPTVKDLPIPEGVTSIQSYAFTSDYFNYGNVVFPSSISSLCEDAFYDSYFDSVSFKSTSNLKVLKGFRFSGINTVIIPNSVTTIEPITFHWGKMKKLLFEKDSQLETIGELAFEFSTLPEIELPDSVKTIGNNAFKESKIENITIGSGCTSLAVTAFSGCTSLKRIIVSENNEKYCSKDGILMDKNKTQIIFIPTSSEKLEIPNTVTEIGKTMLQLSPLLTTIILDGGNQKWEENSGVLYSKGFKEVVAVCGGISEVSLPSSVIKVGDFAAFGCEKLSSFSFNEAQVTELSQYSFAKTGFQSFDLPDTVITIGINAFEDLSKLESFTMKETSPVTVISFYCFHLSALRSFSFGKNVQIIGEGAFWYCTNLSSITFPLDAAIEIIGAYAFEKTNLIKIELPATITDIYRRCFRFCENLTIVDLSKCTKLKTITEIAFEGCSSLWKVVLPNSCKTLETKSFFNCTSLTSFTHDLTTIGNNAFEICNRLTVFNFSNTQVNVSAGMFRNCNNLIKFTVAEGNPKLKELNGCIYSLNYDTLYLFPPGREIAKIPPNTVIFNDNAFAWSPKLKFVAFYSDSNLETIGETAFYECKQLVTVQFPAKLRTIKRKCFYGCTLLKSILLPPTLNLIEAEAFFGCTRLVNVKYCGTKSLQGNDVFESRVIVFVTDLYPDKLFYSIKVYNKLSYDCELKPEFLPTCKMAKIGISPLSFLSIFLIIV